jgi:hypothetical protein
MSSSTKQLPSEYISGRFYLRPVTVEGIPLRLYTDTGGGDFLRESAVSRLGIPVRAVKLGEEAAHVVAFPEFKPDAWIPSISTSDDPRSAEARGCLMVYPDQPDRDSDGVLGQAWFGGRVWTFDYPGERMLLEETDTRSAGASAPLGFRSNSDGRRGSNFPSIDATIEGQTFPFLFDTGATAFLTPEAQSQLGGPPNQGTCFVTAHLFDRWRRDHTHWKYVENGDKNVGGQPMIQVPSVTIASLNSGPVWFTRRPDPNFHRWMSSMMDRKVEGALGGSLFQYFRVTVDYPNAVAYFEEP